MVNEWDVWRARTKLGTNRTNTLELSGFKQTHISDHPTEFTTVGLYVFLRMTLNEATNECWSFMVLEGQMTERQFRLTSKKHRDTSSDRLIAQGGTFNNRKTRKNS